MSDYTRPAGTIATALLLAVMAGCTDGRLASSPILDYGMELVGLGPDDAPPAEAAPSIGPPLFVGYNTIRVALPNTENRGQSRNYVAPDGVEIAMNNGHVTRVIGLGLDLEGMYLPSEGPYVTGFVQAAREGAVTDRVADYFSKRQMIHDTFRCSLNYVPREGDKGIVNEQCRRFFGGPGFRNTYWTEGDRIVCSLQWFHPKADKLQFFETPAQAQRLDLTKEGC